MRSRQGVQRVGTMYRNRSGRRCSPPLLNSASSAAESVPERVVRFTEQFFNRLDRLLPSERGGDGIPSVTDFLLFDLPTVRDALATNFERQTFETEGASIETATPKRSMCPRNRRALHDNGTRHSPPLHRTVKDAAQPPNSKSHPLYPPPGTKRFTSPSSERHATSRTRGELRDHARSSRNLLRRRGKPTAAVGRGTHS